MKHFYTSLFVLLAFFTSCNKPVANLHLSDVKRFYGIWANDDCQLIHTEKLWIYFERDDEQMTVILRTINKRDDSKWLETSAVFTFDADTKELTGIGFHPYNPSLILADFRKNHEIKLLSGKMLTIGKQNMLSLSVNDESIEEIDLSSNKLRVKNHTNDWQSLRFVESIEIDDTQVAIGASDQQIADCLQQWQLGSRVYNFPNRVEISIGTNQNSCFIGYGMYNDYPLVFARSAKLVTNNKGCVYYQNLRMMSNAHEFTAWMVDNNFQTLADKLMLDETYFETPAYDLSKDGFYMPVISFTKSNITLRGAYSKDVIISRPRNNTPGLLERFVFVGAGEI